MGQEKQMFYRSNPYSPIANTDSKTVGELIIELGEKLKDGSVTSKQAVEFFQAHKICFPNERTGMLSSDWREPEADYNKAVFTCVISCSCGCGPMDEDCNQLGPGSKPKYNFTFKE